MSKRQLGHRFEICFLVIAVMLLAAVSVQAATWNGYVEAHSDASDPPAAASTPADDTLSFTVNSNGQLQWVPNPPIAEGNWDNDSFLVGGQISWHDAISASVSSTTEAQSKAKSGLDSNGNAVVVARAKVLDPTDSDLTNNGGDNTALATSKAQLWLPLVWVDGPGGSVDAELHTDVYVSDPNDTYRLAASDTSNCTLDVGEAHAFQLSYTATASAQYPSLGIVIPPGVVIDSELSINEEVVYAGSATMVEGDSEPDTTGDFVTMSFEPWTEPGTNGEWSEGSYYCAIYQYIELPYGYEFKTPDTPTMSQWGLISMAVMLVTAGAIAIVIVQRRRLAA